jgi:hypothetical protein
LKQDRTDVATFYWRIGFKKTDDDRLTNCLMTFASLTLDSQKYIPKTSMRIRIALLFVSHRSFCLGQPGDTATRWKMGHDEARVISASTVAMLEAMLKQRGGIRQAIKLPF